MLGCHHARSISARWEAESVVAAWRRSRSLCGEAAGAGTAGGDTAAEMARLMGAGGATAAAPGLSAGSPPHLVGHGAAASGWPAEAAAAAAAAEAGGGGGDQMVDT